MEHNGSTTPIHPLAQGPAGPSAGAGAERWRPAARPMLDARQTIAVALIALGMIGVIVAWFGISGTLDPGRQMPYLASGGIGGAALIAIGVMVYVSHEHVQDRAAIAALLDRLESVEAELQRRLEHDDHAVALNGRVAPARRRVAGREAAGR
jgi:hypothetical protein